MSEEAMTERTQIAIVGGGMVGAALALALSRLDLNVTVIEPQPRESLLHPADQAESVSDFEPRVSALTESTTRQLLTDLGAWPMIESARHCAYRQMRVCGMRMAPAASTLTPRICRPNASAPSSRTVRPQRPHPGHGTQPRHTLAGQRIRPPMAPHSHRLRRHARQRPLARGRHRHRRRRRQLRIRQWAGLATREWDYDQQAIVCTARTEKPHQHTAWQRFMSTGPVAYLPMANEQGSDHFVSIVWSQDVPESARLMNLDNGAFAMALSDALENTLGDVQEISTRHAIPCANATPANTSAPASPRRRRRPLHPPLAGQGVNLGFADVAVLADELRRAQDRGLPIGHLSALQRYQRRRKVENLS